MRIVTGWGTNHKVVGGMLKGKAKRHFCCPFCGADLKNGKCLGEVSVEAVTYVPGIGWEWHPPNKASPNSNAD